MSEACSVWGPPQSAIVGERIFETLSMALYANSIDGLTASGIELSLSMKVRMALISEGVRGAAFDGV